MNRFLSWAGCHASACRSMLAALALPLLLLLFLSAGCSEGPPRTPKQTTEEARQAAAAAQNKALAAAAERRQKADSDRSPDAGDRPGDATGHLPPDSPGQDE